jgi:hypothetical protein
MRLEDIKESSSLVRSSSFSLLFRKRKNNLKVELKT